MTEWGVQIGDEEFQIIFEAFKTLCDRKKHVTEKDILALVHNKRSSVCEKNNISGRSNVR